MMLLKLVFWVLVGLFLYRAVMTLIGSRREERLGNDEVRRFESPDDEIADGDFKELK